MFKYEDVINSASKRREDYWVREFTKRGALWIYDDDVNNPHALLTSGKHSSGFFNASKIVNEYPRLAFEAIACICNKIEQYSKMYKPTWVFGSAHGATCIANNIGILLNISAGFTEKSVSGKSKSMKVNSRFDVKKDYSVLMSEDVLTTGGTTIKSIDALEQKGIVVLPFIVILVNRSGKSHLEEREIVSLISKEMPIWEPDKCPLCKNGSEAVRPKENWNKLISTSTD